MQIEKKRGPKNGAMVLDVLHVALGLMIVILGVLTFLNPENHMLFFPVIFFLGGVLNLADGFYTRRLAVRGRKNRRAGWVTLLVGALLVGVSVLSALSIWR
ncbi:MAG TPA: TMEM134 family protein [Candidatus Lachnoclostridium pullistercoris]|uniref:TMEM134 family protein n=1 Tax=Candidatus Lachnoclostridium pullistercoris TaxID=2838632 RepID=A0A9D2T614_9FIRM|nr:TMEM134 family protein [Candidatus Lachnoclostridium pullistercoris]